MQQNMHAVQVWRNILDRQLWSLYHDMNIVAIVIGQFRITFEIQVGERCGIARSGELPVLDLNFER